MNEKVNELYFSLMWGGTVEKVKELLDSGIDANVIIKQTAKTPIYTAINFGMLDIIEFLVSRGAEVNFKNKNEETPLLFAVAHAYPEVCRFLLQKGADPNVKDRDGNSCLDRIKEYTPRNTYRALVPVFMEFEELLNDEEKKKLKKLKPRKKKEA